MKQKRGNVYPGKGARDARGRPESQASLTEGQPRSSRARETGREWFERRLSREGERERERPLFWATERERVEGVRKKRGPP